jgi:alkaline phosphatase D
MYKKSPFLLILLFFAKIITAQIQSGPMVGHADYREVTLWVQTTKAAKVKFNYWEQGKPTAKKSTDEILTSKAKAFTASLIADDAFPGKIYDYEVVIDGKIVKRPYPLTFKTQTLWQYRTDPPSFKFAFGSCTYVAEPEFDRPGNSYGGNYEIFTSIASKKPDFMLWTGDNAYYREVDYGSKGGMMKRMTHTRSLTEMQPLLGSASNYAIWDDHDYGPNNTDRSYVLKNSALDVFKTFWGNANYAFENEGVTSTFEWADVQFFLLDDFWWKAPTELYHKNDRGDYLGEKQLQWLIDALSFSKAPFKIIVVGGQIINPVRVFENMSMFDKEREKLLAAITAAKIQGVLFVSGDRHHTIIHKIDRPGTYPLHDITVSPLTSGPGKPLNEEINSQSVVEGTLVSERNFGMMEVTGSRLNRVLKVTVHNSKGDQLWTKEFKATDLK